jgi:hypothetical protein
VRVDENTNKRFALQKRISDTLSGSEGVLELFVSELFCFQADVIKKTAFYVVQFI